MVMLIQWWLWLCTRVVARVVMLMFACDSFWCATIVIVRLQWCDCGCATVVARGCTCLLAIVVVWLYS
eukprot:1382760-Amorphochlora_amoeboformis.AAC.1